MSFNYSPKIVTDGLVLCLDAGNPNSYPGSGTTWKDLSRGKNNGTLVNDPTFSGENSGTLVFDGVNDYVDCGYNNITKPAGAMTISYWFKGKSASTSISGIGSMADEPNRGYLLGPNNGTSIVFFIAAGGSLLVNVQYNITIDINKWYYLTGVYNPSTYLRIYTNGELSQENTLSIPSSQFTENNTSLKLGQRGDGTNFVGNISYFKLYHRVLSPQEIQQNFNATRSRFGI